MSDAVPSAEVPQTGRNLKGTWLQAIQSFITPVFIVLAFRWLIFEPFVIPSGSMIPHLLVHDHIFVKKWSLGVRNLWGEGWLFKWSDPKRGDIVVFKYPLNPEVFYVKRLIGLPGDKVQAQGRSLWINGVLQPKAPVKIISDKDLPFDYFTETLGDKKHLVRYLKKAPEAIESAQEPSLTETTPTWTVPENQYFFMGDNRDQSSDGRVWGFVPNENLIGTASVVWLSCEDVLQSAPYLCDPALIRWNRFFRSVDSLSLDFVPSTRGED